jgi:uncharacterized protein YraI
MNWKATMLAAAAAMGLAVFAVPAQAQYCEGTVFGLSDRYDLAKGTGFLAVRAAPSSKARMVGELYNGNTVEIFARQGNWYRVAMGGIDGWANARWMRNSCRY